MERRFITADQAIELLPDGNEIHTFYNEYFGLFGCDWSREDIIDKLRNSDKIELTGETARGMGHGLAAYNDGAYQNQILFIETDMEKLDKFDGGEDSE